MKALILGVTGMLGHQIYLKFKKSKKFSSVKGTIREKKDSLKNYKLFVLKDIHDNIDFDKNGFEKMREILLREKPGIVVNCVGVKPNNVTREKYFLINSFLPQYLARILDLYKGKLIQISTDGVFSGKKGNYSEDDFPDAKDIYGQSKFFGEAAYGNHLTIRTSIFGQELFGKKGLLEWFLSSKKSIRGYKNVYFSGISTNLLAEIIIKLINRKIDGLINIGSKKKINKYGLLFLINKEYKLEKKIIPSEVKKKVDRSLNVSKMLKLRLPLIDYKKMIENMRKEYIKMKKYYDKDKK